MSKFGKFFNNVDSADTGKSTGKGRFFEAGEYLVKIDEITIRESTNPANKGKVFMPVVCEILEFEGVQYTDSKGEHDTRGSFEPGDFGKHVPNIAHGTMGLTWAKKIGMAVYSALLPDLSMDEIEASITQDSMGALCEPEQPARGVILRVSGVPYKNESSGAEGVVFEFSDPRYAAPVREPSSE